MRRLIAALVAGLLCLSPLTPAVAQTAAEVDSSLDGLFGEHKPYRAFFEKLQAAVASGDKQAVAGMVDYPFHGRIAGKAVRIRDAAHFVADYDKIVTSKVKTSVANQTYATLFANWQGVCIGDGEVWFSGVGDANVIRITAIND